jgi:hypothetical protein
VPGVRLRVLGHRISGGSYRGSSASPSKGCFSRVERSIEFSILAWIEISKFVSLRIEREGNGARGGRRAKNVR